MTTRPDAPAPADADADADADPNARAAPDSAPAPAPSTAAPRGRLRGALRSGIVFLLLADGTLTLVLTALGLAGVPRPVVSAQLLWVDVLTAVALVVVLAPHDAAHGPLLTRERLRYVVTAMLLTALALPAVFLIEVARGSPVEVARTAAATMLVLGRVAYLLSCRYPGAARATPVLLRAGPVWTAAAVLVGAQLLATTVPEVGLWVRSAELGPRQWALTTGLAIVVLVATATARSLPHRRPHP